MRANVCPDRLQSVWLTTPRFAHHSDRARLVFQLSLSPNMTRPRLGSMEVRETATLEKSRDPDSGIRRINQYAIHEELGRGAHGKVKKCTDITDNASPFYVRSRIHTAPRAPARVQPSAVAMPNRSRLPLFARRPPFSRPPPRLCDTHTHRR